jgi:hypothetical protein
MNPMTITASLLRLLGPILAECDMEAPNCTDNSKIWLCANQQLIASNQNVIERVGSNLLSILDSRFICVVNHQQIIERLTLPSHPVDRWSPCRLAPKGNADRMSA